MTSTSLESARLPEAGILVAVTSKAARWLGGHWFSGDKITVHMLPNLLAELAFAERPPYVPEGNASPVSADTAVMCPVPEPTTVVLRISCGGSSQAVVLVLLSLQ